MTETSSAIQSGYYVEEQVKLSIYYTRITQIYTKSKTVKNKGLFSTEYRRLFDKMYSSPSQINNNSLTGNGNGLDGYLENFNLGIYFSLLRKFYTS